MRKWRYGVTIAYFDGGNNTEYLVSSGRDSSPGARVQCSLSGT